MNILRPINNAILAGFAKLLTHIQDSPWWQNHLASEEQASWDQIVASAQAILPQDERYKKLCEDMFKTQVEHVWQTTKADPNFKAAQALKIAAHTIKNLTPLTALIGVQPMNGPVGLYFHMAFNQSEGRMSLEVKRHTVSAMTRKLRARWSLEALQDFSVGDHDLDFESEIAQAIGSEVAFEIVNEVLTRLCIIAGKNEIEVSDSLEKVSLAINSAANAIAKDTRRGPANFIVCSPLTLSGLQASSAAKFSPAEKNEPFYGDHGRIEFCGILNETIKVYATVAPGLPENKILVGYKGENGEIDCGLVYCPYVPVMTGGAVIDPATFTPSMTTMTRYGLGEPDNAQAYFRLVDVGDTFKL